MKIYCFTICHNEEIILPHFLKHYSSFCDKIFVYDDNSTDKSREIVKSFPKAVLLDYPYNDEINDANFSKLKNNCWKEYKDECDYVIVVDADEFLYSEDFSLLDKDYTIFKPYGYNMVGKDLPKEDILKEIPDGVRTTVMDKCCLFNPKEIEEINYSTGCHEITPVGNIKVYHNEDLKLLHYKVLSCQYNIDKNKTKAKRMSQVNIDNEWGTYVFMNEQSAVNIYNDLLENAKKIIWR